MTIIWAKREHSEVKQGLSNTMKSAITRISGASSAAINNNFDNAIFASNAIAINQTGASNMVAVEHFAGAFAGVNLPGNTIGTLIINNNRDSEDPALKKWETQMETQLSSDSNEIVLTKKEVQTLIELLRRLDERTKDIHSLADGRTQFGPIVTGNPSIFGKYFMDASDSMRAFDFKRALTNAQMAIDIIESTKIDMENRDGNVVIPDSAKASMYAIAAFSEAVLYNNPLAHQYAEKALTLNQNALNRMALVIASASWSSDFFRDKNYARSLALDSEAISNYETLMIFNTNYSFLSKDAVATLYLRAMINCYYLGKSNEMAGYQKQFSSIPDLRLPGLNGK